jgi:general stress protein YciG
MMTITDMARLGGKARAASMTPERRRQIARKASKAAKKARRQKALDLASKVGKVSA